MAECAVTEANGCEFNGGDENNRVLPKKPVITRVSLRRSVPRTLVTPLRRRGRLRGRGRGRGILASPLKRSHGVSISTSTSKRGIGLGLRTLGIATTAAATAPTARGMSRRVYRKRCSPFLCRACNRTYLHRELYVMHIQLCHSGESLKCKVCNTDMCCQYHYDLHLKHHTTRTEYVCQFCQRASPTIEWLRVHVEEHIGQTPLLCDQCELDFQSKIEMSAAPKLMCFAPMIFKSVEELNVHIKFRHQTLATIDGSQITTAQCKSEGDGISLLNQLISNEMNATRLVCSCCLRTYNSDYDLQVHRERHALMRSNGTMGCGMYELFNLCLDGKYLAELGLRDVKLRVLLKRFLEMGFNFKDTDSLYISTETLLVKFFRKILDDDDMSDIVYVTPINDLVSEMVFVLKEIWPLDQTYTQIRPKQEVL